MSAALMPVGGCAVMSDVYADVSGWSGSGNHWTYLEENHPVQSAWRRIEGKWYYFDQSGMMKTGWLKDGNGWYYLKSDGAMAADTWIPIQGCWYRFDSSGVMKTSWLKLGNSWYYLNSSGAMLCDGTILIGDSYHTFDKNGRWVRSFPDPAQTSDSANELKAKTLDLSIRTQENGYYCGPAVLQAVLAYHGIDVSQNQLARELNTSSVTGTEYEDLARVANHYLYGDDIGPMDPGYHVQTLRIGQMTAAQKKQLLTRIVTDLSTDDPVFVAVNVARLYPNRKDGNHFVVITGYSEFSAEKAQAKITYLDPSWINGGEHTVSFDDLVDAVIFNEEPAYVY